MINSFISSTIIPFAFLQCARPWGEQTKLDVQCPFPTMFPPSGETDVKQAMQHLGGDALVIVRC